MSLKFALAVVVLAFSAAKAEAEIVVTLLEVGGNLEMSFNPGTVNATGLTGEIGFTGGAKFYSGTGTNLGGGGSPDIVRYSGVGLITVTKSSGWTNTGTDSEWSAFSGTSSIIVREIDGGLGPYFYLETGTTTGVNNLTAFSGTVNGATFASSGLSGNEWIKYSWAADSITFQTSSVPEPTSIAMCGIATLGLARRRRKP